MSDKLRIAIIGCGYWGMNYVRLIADLPSTQLAIVCDAREERLQAVHERYNVPVTTELEDVLKAGVDAAIICTNAASHYAIARELAQAGIHLLIEKPIATTSEDAEALIQHAEECNVTLMVGHIFVYNPGVEAVKRYLDKSKIGEIYYLYATRTNLGPIREDVNAVWDLATHDIAIYNYLLGGEPEWISAVGAAVLHNCREDVGFVTMGYPGGIIGHIHVSWANPSKVREVVVVGSNLRVAFNDLNPAEKVMVYEKGVAATEIQPSSYGEYQLLVRDGDIISPRIEIREPLKHQVQHFIDCVINGTRPLSDGHAGLAVVRCLEAIDKSIQQKGQPMYLTPQETRIYG